MSKTLQFESTISNVKKINPLFSSCLVRVLYTGVNRNRSDISEEVVNNAIDTIYNIPIVGYFMKEKDDFGDHGNRIVVTDSGIEFERLTVPLGTIPESAHIYWKELTEKDGTVNNYLHIDGAILWTGRYPEAFKVVEEGRPQSMEIDIVSGQLNENKIYKIDEMIFSALCILGENVEPAFQSAYIGEYSLDTKYFKQEFSQLLAELKFTIQKELNNHKLKGGIKMEETKEEFVETPAATETDEEEKEVEVTVEVEPEEEKDETEEMMTAKENDKKFELLESEFTKLKEDYSLLETEVISLREFKAQKLHEEKEFQINEIFESVSSELTEDEIKPFKEKAFEMEVSDLKKELFALIGQKQFSNKPKQSTKKFTMSITGDDVVETEIANSYDSIIKKYVK